MTQAHMPPTAALADAAHRVGAFLRVAPANLRPLIPGSAVSGPALPFVHRGGADTLLEAIDRARRGQVLVIDNQGRRDEACVGDLLALEVQVAGLAGIVVWGLHRDTSQLCSIALPLYSLGSLPIGPDPSSLHERQAASDRPALLGTHPVRETDFVVADDDGVLLLGEGQFEQLVPIAREIEQTERSQAERLHGGETLRSQLDLAGYLQARERDASLTFSQHLRRIGGAIGA